jgi:uncharacterized protein with ParB-like and HNH nuclease domain
MPFELRTESIKQFIEDYSIKLPRFQRKQTWDDNKNFKLCLSIFKDYPLGVVVIKKESGKNSSKYLLDGRQRRNALLKFADPEEVYKWAQSFIKFKSNDSIQEISDKFWEAIDQYLGQEENEEDEIKENLEDNFNI